MENVYSIAYQNHNPADPGALHRQCAQRRLSADHKTILAGDHGVPQLRQRLICVGIRTDLLKRSRASTRPTTTAGDRGGHPVDDPTLHRAQVHRVTGGSPG